ncbi:SWI-SNF complex subunit [Dendryphion nanum]|uniref:SWI-SNF complex subunit n=1 Tax=Dendryphion nanum TaxID=256645 RepID=A0A9P9EEY3_9PLEO|nr:SWI-SNF complex subunit [Dendryphion nanum]
MISKTDLEHMFRKSGPIVPPQQPVPQHYAHGHMQAQQQQQQAHLRAENERRRRIAMMPTDKNMPEGVEDICIGDGVARYKELRDLERTLDATMMRKKLELADSVHHSRTRRYGTMRIWISNTAENQPWQASSLDNEAFDFESGTNSTYRVKIQGRLLDDGSDEDLDEDEEDEKDPDAMEEDGPESKKPASAPKPKMFSQFFTSIVIDFDRANSLQPDNFTQIEWKRPENSGTNPKESNFSELVFQRKGDENINITINLQRQYHPERYRLSQPLAELLDTDEEDRAAVMMGIWEYARSQNLQQDEDERKFVCDAKLKALFNHQDSFYFPNVPQLIKPHLKPLPPVQLSYTIRVDKDYLSPPPDSGVAPSKPTIYDVRVPLDDPLQPMVQQLLRPKDAVDTLNQIRTTDEQLVLLMAAISQSKAKHAFFTSMAKDPVSFVKRWLSSQKRDLEVLLGEAARGGGEDASGEEWHRGGPESVWASEVAKESVALWLARQNVKGH